LWCQVGSGVGPPTPTPAPSLLPQPASPRHRSEPCPANPPFHQGSVYFGNSETGSTWPGGLDGAVGAGERAALEVLQQLKPQSLTPREVALVSTQTYRPTKQRSLRQMFNLNQQTNESTPQVGMAGRAPLLESWAPGPGGLGPAGAPSQAPDWPPVRQMTKRHYSLEQVRELCAILHRQQL